MNANIATTATQSPLERDVASQLDREQVGPRVEPDDELAALALDLRGEPVGERVRRDRHRSESSGVTP